MAKNVMIKQEAFDFLLGKKVICLNEETMHLAGTKIEEPEFYQI